MLVYLIQLLLLLAVGTDCSPLIKSKVLAFPVAAFREFLRNMSDAPIVPRCQNRYKKSVKPVGIVLQGYTYSLSRYGYISQ
jgi:hypothetical protein